MSVIQAGTPIDDAQLASAHRQGAMTRLNEELAWCQPGIAPIERSRCRLYPKLAFFFDGTGNNLWEELKKPVQDRALSNIAKLYQAAIDDKDGKEAVRTYIPGVGTPYKYAFSNISPNEDKGGLIGLGFGAGGDMRLNAALFEFGRILESDWGGAALPHLQWVSLSVFGFSRGATLARAFVRKLIAEHCQQTENGLVWISTYGKRVPLRIVFMGLFDTVASVGGPGFHMGWASALAIPREVERCVHYVSGHEVRKAFPLDSVRVDKSYPSNCMEVVYPGVHSDVGGGYFDGFQGRSNLLSRIPLRDMYAEALKSGVMLHQFTAVPPKERAEMLLPADAPILSAYQAYMSSLASGGSTLESLIHAHRTMHFRWRGAITRDANDHRVLGMLHRRVDPAMCEAVPARNNHKRCPPNSWSYELPKDINAQAKQLLSEHRRLVQKIPDIRDPVEKDADREFHRARTEYENLIIQAWDNTLPIPHETELLLAEHIHDSVAHFTDWPCALHDQRGIYCDQAKVYANTAPALATPTV